LDGTMLEVPVGNIYYSVRQNGSTDLRLYIRPIVPSTQILIDWKRSSQYDDSGVNSNPILTNSILSEEVNVDDVIYTLSREMHRTWIRQQDPDTNNWSLHEVNLFVSGNRTTSTDPAAPRSRVTVWVYEIYSNVLLP